MHRLLVLSLIFWLMVTSLQQQQVNKRHTLTVMHLVPTSGDDAFNVGTSCILANEIATKAVNSRSDILANYHIEMRYIDEETGVGAPKQAINYVRSFEGPDGDKTFQSPIIIGPQYSMGCLTMGRMLKQINSVALSTYCMAPGLSERKQIPNMYLSQTTEKNIMEAYLKFIRQVGDWKQFAILANIKSFRNYQSALFLMDRASVAGVAVRWVDMFVEATPNGMELLKQTDVRIIAVVTSSDSDTNNILCEAYNAGLTGRRYTFLADVGAFVDPSFVPDELYPGCTRQKLIEQMKVTIWFGDVLSPLPERAGQKSFLGHTYPEVDAAILANLTGNQQQPADWLARFLCYDAAVRTFAALDDAENKLNKMNMSLRDYRTNPSQVAKVANDSLHYTKAMGLRTPDVMSFNEYGNVDSDVQEVDFWLPGKSLQTLATFHQIPNTTEYQYDSYYFRWVGSLEKYWKAPKDQALHVNLSPQVSESVFIAVLVHGVILACNQVAGILYTALNRTKVNFPFAKILGTFGCLILDVGAVVFVAQQIDSHLATASNVLLVIGSALVTSTLTARPGFIVRTYLDKTETGRHTLNRGRSSQPSTYKTKATSSNSAVSITRFPAAKTLSRNLSIIAVNWQAFDRKTCLISLAFLALNGALLLAWFLSDTMLCSVSIDTMYNVVEDTLIETRLLACSTKHALIWSLTILFFQVAVLFAGLVFAYHLGHLTISCPEYEFMRIGVANASTVMLGMLLIVVVVRHSIGQRVAVAFGILFLSATTSTAWYYPVLKKIRP